jgi:hypothetical protein
MFTAAKNALAGKAAQVYLNNLISRYGRLQDLKIDSNNKTVEAVCLLQGEKEPLVVRVGRYEIQKEGERWFIQASACSASRPWLQNLLEDHVQGKRIELPSWAAAAL